MKDKLTDKEFKIDKQVRVQLGNKLDTMQINLSIRKQIGPPTRYDAEQNVLRQVAKPIWYSAWRQVNNSLKMRFNQK